MEKTIEIERPSAAVFGFVSDQLNAPTWQKGLLEVHRLTEGPVGVGTRHTFVRKIAGRRMEAENEYYRYEPDHDVAFRFSGPPPGAGSYHVDALTPTRTRLTTAVEMLPSGLAKLTLPVMKVVLTRQVRSNLETLKKLLESAAADRVS